MSAFEELGVMPEIIRALDDLSWLLPTPVQTEAVPLILGGGDVSVAAETGSGKTGAFVLPILQTVHESRHTPLSDPSSAPPPPLPPRLSPVDRGRLVAVSSDAVVAQVRHPVLWDGLRATHPVASGRWYFVAVPLDDGIPRFGWSSRTASYVLGTDPRGFGYGATGIKSNASRFDSYGHKFSKQDVIVCMIHYKPHPTSLSESSVVISYLKNDQPLGDAFIVSYDRLGQSNLLLYPAVAMKNAETSLDFSVVSEAAEQLGFRRYGSLSMEHTRVPQETTALFKSHQAHSSSDYSSNREQNPLAIVLEPSRELASQVHQEVHKFGKYLPNDVVRTVLLVGGGKPKNDVSLLRSGCDIIAGTLGSIMAAVKNGDLSLENIRFFVLDEADTFATDNLADVAFLHSKVPSHNRVQTLLFSATLHSPEIKHLSEKIQSFPTWVDLKGKESVPENVHHTMVMLDANADISLLHAMPTAFVWPLDNVHISATTKSSSTQPDAEMSDAADERSLTIKKLKLVALKKVIDAHKMSQAMIFVRTQLDGDNVEAFLLQCSGVQLSQIAGKRFRRRGGLFMFEYSCSVLHGGRSQVERNEALAAFKAGEVRFLVCTDVAARGIDVVGLPYLVNMTLPDVSENYIHRVGRVGRAERLGLAISLVAAQKEAVWYHKCGKPKKGVCKQRKLVSAGGCVLWQSEPKMLAEIEDRLKGRIEELGPDFKRKNGGEDHQMYGARVEEAAIIAETGKHIAALQPAVRELVRLEESAQASFFALQHEFFAQ